MNTNIRNLEMKNVMITGGSGFIGHHMLEYVLNNTDANVTILDRLDFAGNLNRLTAIEKWDEFKDRVNFVWHDLKSDINPMVAKSIGDVDVILHLAAGSHVDRSIEDPLSFVMDNVVGTCNLLNYAKGCDHLEKMIYFSTDEVFGPAPEGVNYKEWDRYNSGNPYAASKAGAEELCLSYHNTYKLPIMISHCMNVFGERQHPEKFIPSIIRKVREGEVVTIHSNSDLSKAGSRYYIHAKNVSKATMFLLENGVFGEKYNIVGEKEIDNLELARIIAGYVGKDLKHEMVDFHGSRPGHDLRYALDGEKMSSMGWELDRNLEESLQDVVEWSLANPSWI